MPIQILNKPQVSAAQIRKLAELRAIDVDQVTAIPVNHGKTIFGVLRSHHRMFSPKGKEYLLYEIQGLSLGFHMRLSNFTNVQITCVDPDDTFTGLTMGFEETWKDGILIVGELEINGIHRNLKNIRYLGTTN